MDPPYLQTGLLTKQSDVFSFGVVMLELLTRKMAAAGFEKNSLIRNFVVNHEQGRKATELFDKEIVVTRDLELLDDLAEIVMECMNPDVEQRPTMVDVAKRLSILSKSRELALLQAS
jgi:serine/threonine protein kinase